MTSNNTNSNSNPFGAARPREAVLASRDVDHREFDRKVDEKAIYHPPHRYHQDTKPDYLHQSPRRHQSFDKDNDDWTHDTASITTIHSHHTTLGDVSGDDPYVHVHHPSPRQTSRHHNSASGGPFGAARPREEVLSDKGIDARAFDVELDRRVEEEQKAVHTTNLFTLNHPTTPAAPAKNKKKKINPFGDARPREVVLANKGVDYRRVDKLVDRKIAAERLTPEQDAEAVMFGQSQVGREEYFRPSLQSLFEDHPAPWLLSDLLFVGIVCKPFSVVDAERR